MIRSNIPQALAEIEAELRMRNEAGAIVVEGEAKRRCPVDTGRLRASITHSSDGEGFIVGTNVSYAPFVELGTSKQAAQPYLVPGLMGARSQLEAIYGA